MWLLQDRDIVSLCNVLEKEEFCASMPRYVAERVVNLIAPGTVDQVRASRHFLVHPLEDSTPSTHLKTSFTTFSTWALACVPEF